MDETAVRFVIQYIDDQLFLPSIKWPKEQLEERLYSRWAANELLMRLINNNPRHILSIIIVEMFVYDMVMLAYLAHREQDFLKFNIAINIGEDIKDML